MFGFVKNWLRGPVIEKPASPPTIEPRFHSRPPALPAGSAALLGRDQAQDEANVLQLPLATIFPKLPADLQSKVRLPVDGQAQVVVPLPLIFSQLGRGAIKITFGDLRGMSPENTFQVQTDRDQAVVELPLGEVLARISPEMLPRRAQKSVAIPEEITSPFASNGQGVHVYKPAPTPPTSFIKRQVEMDPFQAAPGFPARGQLTSVPPMTHPTTAAPEKPIAMPKAAPQPAEVPPPTRVLVEMNGKPAKRNGSMMSVALAELAASWPDPIRAEILQSNLTEATVSLPAELMEDSLKKGKAVYSWQQIRSWTNSPEAALAFSPHDATLLELPLRVLTPLFLARLQSAQAPKKISVDQNIPNLFAATPRSENGTTLLSRSGTSFFTKSAPVSAPVAPAAQPAGEVIPEGKFPADTNGKARAPKTIKADTEFLRRFATPVDIVGRAGALEGVAGALVALPDGLLVAGHLPPSMDGDGLAAFTPQIYARVSQSTREFRMGELKDLTFTVGNTPWKIFKAGSVFFAAFGQTGASLPAAALAELADALEHKSK